MFSDLEMMSSHSASLSVGVAEWESTWHMVKDNISST